MNLVEQILDELDYKRLVRQEKEDLATRKRNEEIYKEQVKYYNYW